MNRSLRPSDATDDQANSPYVDPRLAKLNPSFWTAVPIQSAHAATLISHYLEIDHPLLGFFDADLFVRDLVDQRIEFCSSLLVSAVLFWACVRVMKSSETVPTC